MKYFILIFIFEIVSVQKTSPQSCGCKYMRSCYQKMLSDLLVEDEDPCIENVEIGSSTVTVFLQALYIYCGSFIDVNVSRTTFEGRNLYEVTINGNRSNVVDHDKTPIVLIEAGQDASEGPVAFALYLIEQFVACSENTAMITNVRWIILPSTNPDGLEAKKANGGRWHKNLKPVMNKTNGVDITRNFDNSWDLCPLNDNIFSNNYPGPRASSEIETIFISNVLSKYKQNLNTYISLRGDGHSILHPHACKNSKLESEGAFKDRALSIAGKVNQRAGGLQWFISDSIYNMNGNAHCGHSVDYALSKLNIPFAYEMRVFAESSKDILSLFQTLPKGHEASLRAGYFSGIRELYKSILNEQKHKDHK